MEALDKSLEKLVTKGIEVAEKTGNFVIEQAPDLLQEFYRWHLVTNVFVSVCCLIAIVIIWIVWRVCMRILFNMYI